MSRHNRREQLYQFELLDFSQRSSYYNTAVLKMGDGRIKLTDLSPLAPRKTLLKSFKDNKAAKRWGNRQGMVFSRFKVDTTPYFKNIEYLNLKQEPVAIKIESDEYAINKALELDRHIGKGFEIAIDKE